MSNNTMTIREIMKSLNGTELFNKALSTYPLYEPKKDYPNIPKRSELNQRLLNRYKNREIGFETVGRFLEELEDTMCEIMPYYNEMYKTVEIMNELDNPFDNVDFVETYTETRTGKSSSENISSTTSKDESSGTSKTTGATNSSDSSGTNATVESTSKNVNSATPQNELDIAAEEINSIPYADNVTWNKTNNTDSAQTTGTSNSSTTTNAEQQSTTDMESFVNASGQQSTTDTNEHTFTKKGNQGVNTYAHDMIEFRTSIIDVTNMIINDDRIDELFFRLW